MANLRAEMCMESANDDIQGCWWVSNREQLCCHLAATMASTVSRSCGLSWPSAMSAERVTCSQQPHRMLFAHERRAAPVTDAADGCPTSMQCHKMAQAPAVIKSAFR